MYKCFRIMTSCISLLLAQAVPAARSALLQTGRSCGNSIAPRAGSIQTNTYGEQVRDMPSCYSAARH